MHGEESSYPEMCDGTNPKLLFVDGTQKFSFPEFNKLFWFRGYDKSKAINKNRVEENSHIDDFHDDHQQNW